MLYKLAARDEKIDIMQIKEPYAWAESGLIAALPQSLVQKVNTSCTVNGEAYGVCALGTTTGIVYNKTLFAQLGLSVPETYEEFLGICQTLKEHGIIPLGVGGKDLWHFEYWLNHFLRADILSRDPDFLAKCSSGERNWNDPLITDLLTHLNDLFRLGYVDESWPSTPDGALAFHMAEGQVAMVFSGPWLASGALSIDPTLDLGWFYVPNSSGEIIAGDSLDVFWTISKGCANDATRYEAAVSLLEFFYSEGIYENLYTAMAGFSTLTDSNRDRAPEAGILAEANLAHAQADQRISGYVGDENTPPGFEKKLLTLLSQMCAGELTVAETQALASQYWDECLRQEVSYAP
jgi:raffinose/stachyose/melibiose transport system substrate-binding protein